MLEEIGSYEVKTRFSEILRRVAAGEAFTITNRGKPVADLLPSRASTRAKTETAINDILKMQRPGFTDRELRAAIAKGRR